MSANSAPRRRSFGKLRKLPSGRWQASYIGEDGTRRSAPATFRTKTEAGLWLNDVRAQLARGDWQAPEEGQIAFGDYLDAWLKSRPDLAPRTRQLYQNLRRQWFDHPLTPSSAALGQIELRHITPTIVREWHTAATAAAERRGLEQAQAQADRISDARAARIWAVATGVEVAAAGRLPADVLAAWREAGCPRPEPPVRTGRTQVAQAYRLLSTVLGCAARERLIKASPCTLTGASTVRHDERRPVTVKELAVIIEHTAARYQAAVTLAAWSGLRGGELFALTRRHVDLAAGSLRVERAMVELSGKPVSYGLPKSAAGNRVVHLPRSVLDQLQAHLDQYTGAHPDALVFTTSKGGPVTTSRRTAILRPGRRAIDRPDLRWHDLRHTGAVLAAGTGAALADLMARLGHSSPRAALIYQHASSERDRLIAARLDELTQPASSGEHAEPEDQQPNSE